MNCTGCSDVHISSSQITAGSGQLKVAVGISYAAEDTPALIEGICGGGDFCGRYFRDRNFCDRDFCGKYGLCGAPRRYHEQNCQNEPYDVSGTGGEESTDQESQ